MSFGVGVLRCIHSTNILRIVERFFMQKRTKKSVQLSVPFVDFDGVCVYIF